MKSIELKLGYGTRKLLASQMAGKTAIQIRDTSSPPRQTAIAALLEKEDAHALIELLVDQYGIPPRKSKADITRERFALIEIGQEFTMFPEAMPKSGGRIYVKIDDSRYIAPGSNVGDINTFGALWKFEVIG